MKKCVVSATVEQLQAVQDFVVHELQAHDCPFGAQMQIEIAVEEIYINIANYAYNPEVGEATICCEVGGDPLQVTIQFMDAGKPFDPLLKKDADITLSAEERAIGGLGIFMVKKSMDSVDYCYENGKNILTIRKKINI